MPDSSDALQAINLRIESLKANRDLFTILFTIESAILTLSLTLITSIPRFANLDMLFILPTVILLILTLIFMLFGIYCLTDSIHFYSKYGEFNYAWSVVHTRLKDNTQDSNSKKSLERALESDDIGYYFIKLSMVFFLWSLASFILTIDTNNRIVIWSGFVTIGIVFTLILIKSYQITHKKRFKEAIHDFFIKKPVFTKDKKEDNSDGYF
jgi:hypothetical protein